MKSKPLRANPSKFRVSKSSLPPPAFHILLVRRTAAPKRPARQAIAALFARAWRLVPSRRCPDAGRRAAVDVFLVGDAEMARLHATHLKRRGPTDVLSFPMAEFDPGRKAFLLGEIVVSFETARREAAARGLALEEELARYLVHGFLHLMGYDDCTAQQRQEMHALQEWSLEEFTAARIAP